MAGVMRSGPGGAEAFLIVGGVMGFVVVGLLISKLLAEPDFSLIEKLPADPGNTIDEYPELMGEEEIERYKERLREVYDDLSHEGLCRELNSLKIDLKGYQKLLLNAESDDVPEIVRSIQQFEVAISVINEILATKGLTCTIH